MPPLHLRCSYLYYPVEMSYSLPPISFALFLISFPHFPLSVSLKFVLNRWISGRLLTFTSEALLSTDRQSVCLKASRTQRSIFHVNVEACVSRSLMASLALVVSLSMSAFFVCLCVCVCVCVCANLVVLKLWSGSQSPWQAPMLGSWGVCVIAISICFKCWPVTSPLQRYSS